MLRGAHTHECSLELWNKVLAVNLTGTFLVTRAALPALLVSGRRVIVNFSSTSASFAHPFMAAYSASKGGIQSFTHSIAQEYSKQGLRAVSVAPGSIASGITGGFADLVPTDIDWSLLSKLTPALAEGFAPPETVAGVVAMLASDDGAFITGTEIRIDGGTHQYHPGNPVRQPNLRCRLWGQYPARLSASRPRGRGRRRVGVVER
jgi:NAD(P)-dependent dehydrogenase (short-subunit alcohol dehydrogenase family)